MQLIIVHQLVAPFASMQDIRPHPVTVVAWHQASKKAAHQPLSAVFRETQDATQSQ